MSDEIGGDEFEASLQARFGKVEETTPEPEAKTVPDPTEAVETEPETDATHTPTDPRFKGDPRKLEESYLELERRLGEQGREYGTRVKELEERLGQYESQANRQPVSYDDLDPGDATQIAWERGDTSAARAALEQWKVDDPFAAAVWVGNIQRQAELAQLREEYTTTLAPVQQRNQEQTIASAYSAVAARLPDIHHFGDAILEAAQAAPEVVSALQSGTPQDAERVFENLYWLAKGRQADTITAAAQQAQTEQAEANRQAKAQAVVANVSSRPTSSEGKDAIDRFKQSILGVETGLVDRFADQ